MKKISSEELRHKYILENGLDSISDIDILSISELHEFEKNEYLISCDYPSDYLYFLVKGEVIITHDSFDKTICVSYQKPLSWLGEASSLWRQQPTCNVQAIRQCLCIAINLSQYRDTLLNDRIFLLNSCQILSYRLNNSTYFSSDLLEPLEMRLAKFILNNSNQGVFPVQLTTCAMILNTSYRHLLRIIKEFCEKGLLRKEKATYIITNYNGLKSYNSYNQIK